MTLKCLAKKIEMSGLFIRSFKLCQLYESYLIVIFGGTV